MEQKLGRTRANVSVRAGPSGSEERLGVIPADETVEVLSEEGQWVRIRFGDTEGFAFRRYLDLEGPRSPESSAGQKTAEAPELRAGSAGDAVRALQEALQRLGYPIQPDGRFGTQTERVVAEFQKAHGLSATGAVDARTLDALDAADQPQEKVEGKGGEEAVSAAQYTVSDQPAHTVAEDRLGFRHSVLAVVSFLRSEETRAPLALAICAPWGRGKTSFMQMVDEQLGQTPRAMPVRFARVWFNPWKYDDQSQVWAALLAAITACIRHSLGIGGRLQFEARRLGVNLRDKFEFSLVIRLLFLLAIWGTLIAVATQPSMRELSLAVVKNWAGKEASEALQHTALGVLIPLLAACVLGYQLYFKVVVPFNQGLLDYLRKTDYRDKVGTLARFEAEMRELNRSMPVDLKVVVLIDDLDRCKPSILSEIIESLQLLEVSRKCIFVLGMDLRIVVQTVEHEYAELNPEVKRAASGSDSLQHGSGYQFLEKIIQVRLGVPEYGQAHMHRLARSLGAGPHLAPPSAEDADALPPAAVAQAREHGVPETATAQERPAAPEPSEAPTDSPQVTEAIETYGATYFRNPRRLKRFVNTFRMHVYLARASELDIPVDRLARFLVLTESWPGLVDFLRAEPRRLDSWLAGERAAPSEKEYPRPVAEALSEDRIQRLFRGPDDADPIDGTELRRLCDWYGFAYYR